ncbi:MAG: DUF6125 family protein [Acidobacteriota bacterium]
MKTAYHEMSRDELLRALEAFARNWLAHDGCWFLGAEEAYGMDAAIDLDARAWKRFAAAEARRLMEAFGIPENGGLEALAFALDRRMYTLVNPQRLEWSDDRSALRLVVESCRVQETRRRKGLPDFPCKPVGIVEYETFARTVDPRVEVRCLHCPPDAHPNEACAWEFTLRPAGS